ncbi:hypothetical protein GOACH_05_01440 [Gordonia aichiensis NBRC 108223]|uniref:Uncharacterized protein n=1 Tax=Gordonia aichiensis NBRC 108223 TaxID=1220583 RepID=L7KHA7_9ACTN|nr:hypothetical protein GOACH_05_01440 [Gordonia aichiensis NBRC 108223]
MNNVNGRHGGISRAGDRRFFAGFVVDDPRFPVDDPRVLVDTSVARRGVVTLSSISFSARQIGRRPLY